MSDTINTRGDSVREPLTRFLRRIASYYNDSVKVVFTSKLCVTLTGLEVMH